MRIGVVYPQVEFPDDPSAIRDYAQTVEGLGFTHILAYDHILGANPIRPGGWRGPYTYADPFMEPLVLFSFIAGVTEKLEFTSGIIILPQRQTALFAKQAATLDVLCGGRLRIGIGLGWNEVEYVSLNENFHNRGKRVEEQVEILKRLWSEPLVIYNGNWHNIPDAGINPLPNQRPIPIWFGGSHKNVLKRLARFGDGWMPTYTSPDDAKPALELLDQFLEQNGRSRKDIGLEVRFKYGEGNPDSWRKWLDSWRHVGATHVSINTMGYGYQTALEHIEALKLFAKEFLT